MIDYETNLQRVTVFFFCVFLFFYFTMDLIDPDLPWHLATGQHVMSSKSIPTSDPFAYILDDNVLPFTSKFVLSQYWLGQSLLAFVYNQLGVPGLVILRAALFTTIILMVQSAIRKNGYLISLVFSFFYTAYILHGHYYSLRPVLISMFFSALIMSQLLKFTKKSNYKYIAPIPVVMVVWSNIHGGYIFGLLIISVYLIARLISKYTDFRDDMTGDSRVTPLLVITILSFLAASINPNGLDAVKFAITSHYSDAYQNIMELQSPFHPSQRISSGVLVFWCILPLNLMIIILSIKKKQLLPALLTAVSTFMALTAVRFIPFMAITIGFVIGHMQFKLPGCPNKVRWVASATALLIIISGIIWLHPERRITSYRFKNNFSYAASASEFLNKNRINGNVFSSYNKSSFLLFSLYPDSNIYIDSRYLYPDRIKISDEISGASSIFQEEKNRIMQDILGNEEKLLNMASIDRIGKNNSSLAMLDDINSEIVVHEAMQIVNGNLYKLPMDLFFSEKWELVYADGYVMIFLKDIPKFQKIIEQFKKRKTVYFDQLIAEGKVGLRYGLNSNYYTNIAFGLMGKGLYGDNVKELIDTAMVLSPNNQTAETLKTIFNDKIDT